MFLSSLIKIKVHQGHVQVVRLVGHDQSVSIKVIYIFFNSGFVLLSASLETVLLQLAPKIIQSNDNKVPVVVYMRREIVGIEAFKVTALRSLGLTSGRALLR